MKQTMNIASEAATDEPASPPVPSPGLPAPEVSTRLAKSLMEPALSVGLDPRPGRAQREDGWTPERIRAIEALAEYGVVGDAARAAGMTARSAYQLRPRAAASLGFPMKGGGRFQPSTLSTSPPGTLPISARSRPKVMTPMGTLTFITFADRRAVDSRALPAKGDDADGTVIFVNFTPRSAANFRALPIERRRREWEPSTSRLLPLVRRSLGEGGSSAEAIPAFPERGPLL